MSLSSDGAVMTMPVQPAYQVPAPYPYCGAYNSGCGCGC